MSDYERLRALNQLRADNFDERISPNQKKYYLDLMEFYESHPFETMEEATALIMDTPFYTGITLAKLLDQMHMGELAMREVGYDDVADFYAKRQEILLDQGYMHAYTPQWMEELNQTEEILLKYAKRKEVFGSIYNSYLTLIGDVNKKDRQDALGNLKKGFEELQALGTSFEELSQERAYKLLTLMSDEGYAGFVEGAKAFSRKESLGEEEIALPMDDVSRAVEWLKKHHQEVIDAGRSEGWGRANFMAVPSEEPLGYDFVNGKEGEY